MTEVDVTTQGLSEEQGRLVLFVKDRLRAQYFIGNNSTSKPSMWTPSHIQDTANAPDEVAVVHYLSKVRVYCSHTQSGISVDVELGFASDQGEGVVEDCDVPLICKVG